MNKYVSWFINYSVLFSLMISLHAPLWSMGVVDQRVSAATQAAPSSGEMRQDLKGALTVLKDKTKEAIELSQEIKEAKKAGLSAIIIDKTIGRLLVIVEFILLLFAVILYASGVLLGIPFLGVLYRSLTKDIKKGTPEAAIKRSLSLEQALPYILSGKLSPNILNITLAYSEKQDRLIAALKQGDNLSKLEKGLKWTSFLLNRLGTYVMIPPKLFATVILLGLASLSASVAAIPLLPAGVLYQLVVALDELRKKISIEPVAEGKEAQSH